MSINHICINAGIGGILLGFNESIDNINTVMLHENYKPSANLLHEHWNKIPITVYKKEFFDGIDYYGQRREIDIISGRIRKNHHWNEFFHAARALRPKVIAIEALAKIRGNGLVRILQRLWEIGYDAEWHIIPSGAVGCCFRGERCWIISYPNPDGRKAYGEFEKAEGPMGGQYIASPLFNELGIRPQGDTGKARGGISSEPKILRRDNPFSRKLDRTRIKMLTEDISPKVSKFIGTCINRILVGSPGLPPNFLGTTNYFREYKRRKRIEENIKNLSGAGILFSRVGNRCLIDVGNGKLIHYWPASDTYWDRKKNKSKSGIENLIKEYFTGTSHKIS